MDIRQFMPSSEKAREKEWCQLIAENNRVYFLPEAKARILPKDLSDI